MKTPHTPTADSFETIDPRLHEVFKDFDQKIEQLSQDSILSLIEAIEFCIKNNHQRLMGIGHNKLYRDMDLNGMRSTIEKDNHYLSGTILPKLYNHIES